MTYNVFGGTVNPTQSITTTTTTTTTTTIIIIIIIIQLLALMNKNTGGVRPIAIIGFTPRRLASKCASSAGIARLKSYFQPRQLGVGTAGGCEAAIHAARRYLESLPPDHVVVKLDFSNAFNTLHRRDMLQAIFDRLPEL